LQLPKLIIIIITSQQQKKETQTQKEMVRIFTSIVINAPADKVWEVVRRFSSLASWANPAALRTAILNGKAETEIGAVRGISTPGPDGENAFLETLVAFSEVEKFYEYSLDRSPLPASNYRGRRQVVPVTDNNTTFVTWSANFDAPNAEAEAKVVSVVGTDIFGAGLKHLQGLLNAQK
jgi:hypothetical protein